MARRLVDIDDRALRAAQRALGTATLEDTVNGALLRAADSTTSEVRRALDVLAEADLARRATGWR